VGLLAVNITRASFTSWRTRGWSPNTSSAPQSGRWSARFDWTNPFNVLKNVSEMQFTSMWPFNGLNLEEVMRKFVEDRQLQPKPKLKLVACQLDSLMYNFGMVIPQRLVIFEMPGSPGCGESTSEVLRVPMLTQADLVKALAASCCVVMPGVINPVECEVDGKRILLGDGGLQHPHYTGELDPPTIVAKLIGMPHYSERECDFVVNLSDDMEPIFGSVSQQTMERMQREGYERTKAALNGPIEAGLIPTGKSR
jgi:hypothetical protein